MWCKITVDRFQINSELFNNNTNNLSNIFFMLHIIKNLQHQNNLSSQSVSGTV